MEIRSDHWSATQTVARHVMQSFRVCQESCGVCLLTRPGSTCRSPAKAQETLAILPFQLCSASQKICHLLQQASVGPTLHPKTQVCARNQRGQRVCKPWCPAKARSSLSRENQTSGEFDFCRKHTRTEFLCTVRTPRRLSHRSLRNLKDLSSGTCTPMLQRSATAAKTRHLRFAQGDEVEDEMEQHGLKIVRITSKMTWSIIMIQTSSAPSDRHHHHHHHHLLVFL